MKTLVSIDRSTSRGSFAIVRDGETVAFKDFTETVPRSPEWFPALATELSAVGIDCAAVDAYAVGIGPGSFSGIRAVLAAVQGLALPFGTPVLGFLSSSAAAYSAFRSGGRRRITVVGDARRGMLWVDSYDFSNPEGALAGAKPMLVPYPDAPTALAQDGDRLFLSPDRDRVAAALAGFDNCGIAVEESIPTAADVALLCADFPEVARLDPTPAYLHPAVQPTK